MTQEKECPMKTILKNKEIQHQGLDSQLSTTVEIFTDQTLYSTEEINI